VRLFYDFDGVQLYHGDARRLDALAENSIQMVITSPPYWNAKAYSNWPTYDAYLADMARDWAECYRVLCDGGRIAVNVLHGYNRPGNGGYKPMDAHTTLSLLDVGFALRGHIIWDKAYGGQATHTAWGSWQSASNPSLRDVHETIIIAYKGRAGREGESTIGRDDFLLSTRSVWHISPERNWHPAPFPAEIPRRLVELYTFKGDTVLDPFSGSGTTAFTAARLARRGIGVELNEEYVIRSAGPLLVVA